ncbi:MAG TPA: restriction endonuclease subunit S, partial [Archangium sp.]|nr:restriction endonuclease subunit S [Archangium sp.]
VYTSDLSPRWIGLFGNSPVGRRYFEEAAKQTTNLASINMTQLRHCPVPVPPAQEQIRILKRVDQLMALCDELEARLRDAEKGAQRLAEAMTAAMVA